MAKTGKQGYTTVSVYPNVAEKIDKVQSGLRLRNRNQAVEVLLAAYDLINGTGYGGRFSESVRAAFDEGGKQ